MDRPLGGAGGKIADIDAAQDVDDAFSNGRP